MNIHYIDILVDILATINIVFHRLTLQYGTKRDDCPPQCTCVLMPHVRALLFDTTHNKTAWGNVISVYFIVLLRGPHSMGVFTILLKP